MPSTRQTVLIVDDHAGFRAQARKLLQTSPHLDVVGEAGTGAEAIVATDLLHPDIVLLDIALPDLDGFVVCERIASGDRQVPIVILVSSRARTAYGPRVAASLARGFIAKEDLSASAVLDLAG